MHRIFVSNRPLQIKVNWLRLFQCDWSNIRDRVDRRSIKAPFVLFLQLDVKDKRVTGVRFLQNGKEQCVEVKKEAVVCGGAVQSPQVSGSGYFLILNFGLWEFHRYFFPIAVRFLVTWVDCGKLVSFTYVALYQCACFCCLSRHVHVVILYYFEWRSTEVHVETSKNFKDVHTWSSDKIIIIG